jgi:hypothetical protein
MPLHVHEGRSPLAHERLSRRSNEFLLINMYNSAKRNDHTRHETKACITCLIMQQPVPNMEWLQAPQIFSKYGRFHGYSMPH